MPPAGLLTVLAVAAPVALAVKPHILFVVADDHGFFDSGYTGTRIRTPNIDAMRAKGIALDSYYVQKVCAPTRAALLTGRFPHRYGLQIPFCGGTPQGLNLNETLLPELLNAEGYTSHAVGKWHLGFTEWTFTPTFRGFSSFYGYYGCAETYFTHSVANALDFHRDATPRCGRNCSAHEFDAVGSYSTLLFAKEAVDVIEKHDARDDEGAVTPLFLYLAFQDTHGPAEVPQSYMDRYNNSIPDLERRKFAGKLTALDEAFGNVTRALEARGFLDNTLIIFTADNGGPIQQTVPGATDAIGASNWPLRGGKHNDYDGGVRVRAWLVPPASAERALPAAAQRQWGGLMHGVDWVPTICAAIGGCTSTPPRPALPLDGYDQWQAILTNGSSARPAESYMIQALDQASKGSAWERLGATGAIRSGDWKLLVGDGAPHRPGDWSNPQPWLNVSGSEPSTYDGRSTFQLFNIAQDPTERNDRAADPQLSALIAQLNASFFSEVRVAHYPVNRGNKLTPVQIPGKGLAWQPRD